jgi:hypothetical protein
MVMTVYPSARMHQVQEMDLAILNGLHERRVAFTIPGIYLCPSIQEKHYKPCVSAVM